MLNENRNVPGLTTNLTSFYNLINRARGFKLPPHQIPMVEALQDDRIRRLMVVVGPGSAKSTLTTQLYPAWKIGRDPNTTIVAVSAGEALVQGFQQGVMEVIHDSPEWAHLFPDIQPDKTRGWSSQNGLFVTGRAPGNPDANMFSAGLASSKLTGVHGLEIIMDDLHNDENSSTGEACKKVVDKYHTLLLGRGDPRGARYIITGRRFHKEDIYGRLSEAGDYVVLRLPAERPGSEALWLDVLVPKMEDGSPMECVFSELYKPEREQDPNKRYIRYKAQYGYDLSGRGFYWPAMASKRKEYFEVKRNSPTKAEAVYQCNPDVKENPIFQDSDFIYFSDLKPDDVKEGILNDKVRSYVERMDGTIIQVWDTAAGKSADSAYSVCVTGMLVTYENWWRGEDPEIVGPAERHNRVYVLDVMRKKLDFEELSTEFRTQNKLWKPLAVIVENRSSGISLIQSFKSSDIPVQSVEAKDGKVSRAIDSVGGAHGSVQGWFRQHRVVLLENPSWNESYVAEFKDFSGTNAGKKDQVDATVYLVAYAIAHGVGMARIPSDEMWRDSQMEAALTPRGEAIQTLMMLGQQTYEHPLDGLCGRCDRWLGRSDDKRNSRVEPKCSLNNRTVNAFDSCAEYREISDGVRNPGW